MYNISAPFSPFTGADGCFDRECVPALINGSSTISGEILPWIRNSPRQCFLVREGFILILWGKLNVFFFFNCRFGGHAPESLNFTDQNLTNKPRCYHRTEVEWLQALANWTNTHDFSTSRQCQRTMIWAEIAINRPLKTKTSLVGAAIQTIFLKKGIASVLKQQ